MLYWSCAQTHLHEEARAVRHLRRQHFAAFYPFSLEKNRFDKLTVRPVFPGYVFIQLDSEAVNWAPINSTCGVRRLLTQRAAHGEYRLPARIDFVDGLRRLRLPRQDGARDEELLPPGTVVKIRRGPFAERVALVTLSAADRVRLLLEVFSREVEIEFALDAVEPIRRPVMAQRAAG